MVVAHRHQHAAMGRGSGHVDMAHHVASAVHPRPLAVPQAEHAVIFALAPQLGLLAAPKRGGGQIFVQALFELHLRLGQQPGCTGHLYVDRPQRRPAIAGHITGGVQTRCTVARRLDQHQPHQRLCAVQQNRRFLKIEAIIQRNLSSGHAIPPRVEHKLRI